MGITAWQRLAAAAALIGVATAARATSVDAAKLARQGDPAHGVAPCASCHGASGQGRAGFPRLAGLPAAYQLRQLDAMADGRRRNAVMSPMARNLSPAQRKALSDYYAHLTPPATAPAPAGTAALRARGAELAEHGDWSRKVPGCERCHGRGGVGVGSTFPPLAGQPAAYIAAQFQAWRARARDPGPQGLMGTIAGRLDSADIQAAAAYFASLPARPKEARP